jgi:hypothetical protein
MWETAGQMVAEVASAKYCHEIMVVINTKGFWIG